MKVIIIKPDVAAPGVIDVVDVEEITLDFLQAQVGGFIEAIDFLPGMHAYINEEGKLDGLPKNTVATDLWERGLSELGLQHLPGDVLVGPVVVLGGLDDEGNDVGLTDEQIAEVFK